jgi:ubiquinone biosynthesis protein Coq4
MGSSQKQKSSTLMVNYSIQNVSCVLNASDLFLMEYFMSLKEENTVSMISMFYLHHAVENAASLSSVG